MDRFHKYRWLLGLALILVAGCKPEPPAELERGRRDIELPAAFWENANTENVAGDPAASLPPPALDHAPQSRAMVEPSRAENFAYGNVDHEQPVAPRLNTFSRSNSPNALTYEPMYLGNFERQLESETAPQEPSPPPSTLPRMSMREPTNRLADTDAAAATDPEAAFASVDVLYATDREQDTLSLSESQFSDQRQLISLLGIGAAIAFGFFVFAGALRRSSTAKLAGGMAVMMALAAAGIFTTAMDDIEKQGVTYSGKRGELVRGVCRVTVPVSHTRGTVERPSLLKFQISEDQAKHIVLTSVSPLDEDAFEARLDAELAAAEQPDLLVFIHGYNVGFESAVLRTAQIAVDLPFHGVPVCYSWPSQGTLLGYPIDENNAAWTVGHLKQFLGELVDRSGAKSIHVVAHSMGNRAMTSALQQMVYQRGGGPPVFDRVVLAAPDVDADLFRKDLAPSLTQIARQVTLYASSHDQALVASKKVHGYPRAGESGDHLVVVPGVDTIDVSGIDLSLLGHSYYGESEPILRDLYDVLLSRLPAMQRQTLVSRLFQSQVYWQLAGSDRIATGTMR